MNLEIGIGLQMGWEYLRVERKLPSLPILQVLFRAGEFSGSKVRLISRVADADNEKTLCHAVPHCMLASRALIICAPDTHGRTKTTVKPRMIWPCSKGLEFIDFGVPSGLNRP